VMISASHNPFADNGIKLFGPDGYKMSDQKEHDIERLVDGGDGLVLATSERLGRAKRVDDAQARYIEFAKRTFSKDLRLDGLRVVVDCANGAGYKVAPTALWELGAEVFSIGVEPNGLNINDKCGSTAPEKLAEKVRELRADIGIALDGDADRVVILDETGKLIDGDQLLALIATSWAKSGQLTGGGIVATVMSNLGLERHLASHNLKLERTKVGDRYVVEHMRANGFNVGGEQSGHIVLSDYGTTGDGLIAALQVLAMVRASGKTVSEMCSVFEPVPQVLRNVRCRARQPLDLPPVRKAIDEAVARLGDTGRLVIRPSGTEPLIRVMAEGDDEQLVQSVVDGIVTTLEREAA
ncbi:MAG TPA: phosphoglucosamine mutase, partial [Kofleriaceae bacterium]|nr:phosphoglucosamine mutase [Kofleriaceae bacterium]